MSTALVEAEIRRFLASDVPEVLCIKGRWGVGKTFAWLKYLGDAQRAGELKANAYAYVSLFGLNTLDDLRFAIFENTVTAEHALKGADVGTFSAMLRRGVDIGRKSKPYLDMVLASVGWGDRGNAFAKASFLLVRNQLICLDDLERAGEGLHQRDVLGLASSLKEQRACKIVLLLNDEEMEEEQRAEFDRQLEKVVDVSLMFAPTAAEAADIAIAAESPIGAMLRPRVVALGIVNIRVIKKIERLALRLHELLQQFREPVVDQAIVTVVLGGWSAFQPKLAPPLQFLREYNRVVLEMRSQADDLAADELRWREQLQEYDFGSADELDRVIFDGVSRGFFDEQKLVEAAATVQERLAHHSRDNSFSRAWDQYHGSLTLDEAKVLNDLRTGALENLPFISPMNINATMKLLREMGRDEQANELAAAYVAARQEDWRFFDLDAHHSTADEEADPALRQAFAARRAEFVDERDPGKVLVSMHERSGWNDEDIELLARLSVDEFEALFEAIQGPDLVRAIKGARMIGGTPGEDGAKVRAAVTEALQRIAAKSPLRARQLRRFGIKLHQPKPAEQGRPREAGPRLRE